MVFSSTLHRTLTITLFTTFCPSLDALAKKVRELHARMAQLEGEKYDWEMKLRRQDIEINELTMKVNDVKGKLYANLNLPMKIC